MIRRQRTRAQTPSRALSRLLLAFALCAAVGGEATSALAEEVADDEGSGSEAVAAVPTGEIGGRAKRIVSRARELQADLEGDLEIALIEEELVDLANQIEPELPEVATVLGAAPSLAALERLQREWAGFRRAVSARERRIERRISVHAEDVEQLLTTRDVWRETLRRAEERNSPASIIASTEDAVVAIVVAIEAYDGELNDALVLQSQLSELQWTVQETLEGIEKTRQRILQNLLVRDMSPLWEEAAASAEAVRAPEPRGLSDWLSSFREATTGYIQRHPDRVALHVLAFLLLVYGVRRTRGSVEGRWPRSGEAHADGDSAPDAVSTTALLATRHPLAAGLVLALLAAPIFHGEVSNTLRELTALLLVIPAILVLRPLLGEPLRLPLYALAGFFVVDRVREALLSPESDRVVFLLELAGASLLLLWLLRSARMRSEPSAPGAERWMSRATTLWARLALGASAFSVLAGCAGYMRGAHLLGDTVLGSAYSALALFAGVRIAESLIAVALRGRSLAGLQMVARHREMLVRRSRWLLRAAAVAGWLIAVLGMLALRDTLANAISAGLESDIGYGAFTFTVGGVLAFFATLVAAWALARVLNFLLEEEVYGRIDLPRGIPFALSTLTRYAILLIGFLLAAGALGFDLDRITILLGAFGVGIGFGLQNIVSNFVSGVILLFERPVKVGDRVALTDVEGEVQRIGIRASTVRTWDGADVLVPNANLISAPVTNWTFADRLRRITVPVGVAYGSDPHETISVLLRIAKDHDDVRMDPEPAVLFMGFGESSLDFEIRVWTDRADRTVFIRSDIGLAAHDALVAAGIEIPFPQRDLHLRSVAPAVRAPDAEPTDEDG